MKSMYCVKVASLKDESMADDYCNHIPAACSSCNSPKKYDLTVQFFLHYDDFKRHSKDISIDAPMTVSRHGL